MRLCFCLEAQHTENEGLSLHFPNPTFRKGCRRALLRPAWESRIKEEANETWQ